MALLNHKRVKDHSEHRSNQWISTEQDESSLTWFPSPYHSEGLRSYHLSIFDMVSKKKNHSSLQGSLNILSFARCACHVKLNYHILQIKTPAHRPSPEADKLL
ncbi:unnamed protein product [Rangifer tarandus platyrhynchus]|uniref:Uncharacterized protein n=1 Tax=Rangifer tarandus platyrhynchus TaxID=3082113 RepID=A0AC59Y8A4_RANTA